MSKRKVASGISKVINKLHGIDKQEPLVEGVDYTVPKEGEGVQLSQEFIDSMRQRSLELLAQSEGMKEVTSTPIMSAVLKPNPKRKETNQKPEEPDNTALKEDKEKLVNKKDPLINNISSSEDSKLKSGDSESNILGKIFNLMVKRYDDDNDNFKEETKYKQILSEKKESRSEELINLFTGKKKKTKISKKEEVKKKPGEVKNKPEEGKKPSKASTAKEIKTPTAERTPSTTPSVSSTASKVIVGAVGVAAAAGMTSAIGGAESGGNYNITYGDTLDKKGNLKRGANLSPEQKYGKDLTELTLDEVNALGKERNRNSPSTSAMGKYQFMNSTLFGTTDKKGVFHPGLVQQSGLDPKTTKFTPQVQDKLYTMLHDQDVARLKKLGVPITPGYEYMAHYLGADGAAAIFNRRNSNMTVQQALVDAGLKDPVHGKTNAELATLKASEFETILQGRLNKQGLGSPHASASTVPATPTPANVDIPKPLSSGQSSNQASTNIVNRTTNVIKNGTIYSVEVDSGSNKPALIEKQYN